MRYSQPAMTTLSFLVTIDLGACPPQPCRTWSAGGVPVVSAPAEVDIMNTDLLRDALLDVCAMSTIVIVDMTATTFFDAGATGVLFSVAKKLRDSGGELRVVARHTRVRKVLGVLKLDHAVPVFTTLTAATSGGEREPLPLSPAA